MVLFVHLKWMSLSNGLYSAAPQTLRLQVWIRLASIWSAICPKCGHCRS